MKRFNNSHSFCDILLTIHSTHTKVEQLMWLEATWMPALNWREGFTSNPLHLKQKAFEFGRWGSSALVVVEEAGALQCSRIFIVVLQGAVPGCLWLLALSKLFSSCYNLHCLSAGAAKCPNTQTSVQHKLHVKTVSKSAWLQLNHMWEQAVEQPQHGQTTQKKQAESHPPHSQIPHKAKEQSTGALGVYWDNSTLWRIPPHQPPSWVWAGTHPTPESQVIRWEKWLQS